MLNLGKLITILITLFSCNQLQMGELEDATRAPSSEETPLERAIANATPSPPVVEIRHLVEPVVDSNTAGGAYLKKLTIPKDYKGKLYLAGINLASLNGKNIKVRFHLGLDRTPVTIPADIGTTPGLINGTSISVLVLNLSHRPFLNLKLKYDLYDYNEYEFDGSNSATALADAVSYNRDTKLFCRGLRLDDDPSFNGAGVCSSGSDICKYAYAKVLDQGLSYQDGSLSIATTPSRPMIANTGVDYYQDSDQEILTRCLPSNPLAQNAATGSDFVFNGDHSFSLFGTQTIDGINYEYRGPFRVNDIGQWQIAPDSSATINKFGLFRPTTGVASDYFNALLFPRYIKKRLSTGTQYLGSTFANEAKVLQTAAASGLSKWIDGCSERVSSRNFQGEHMGSCDVSADIEVIQVNENGEESVITSTSEVKLQLVRDSYESLSSIEVTDPSFASCSSTAQCGGDECCINNRCWDKTIVSSCVEDEPSYGNSITGASCDNDYECASLCCQSGQCQVHDGEDNLCSKSLGAACVAKDWCAKQPVNRCFIVKTGVDSQGEVQCSLQCFTNPESGDCKNGVCVAPKTPERPVYDPTDPNRCSDACDPPDFTNGVFSINCGG